MPAIRAIYSLRKQVLLLKEDIRRLYSAQQDVEEMLMTQE